MNPLPTILSASQSAANVSETEREQLNTKTLGKPPTWRVFHPDELQRFKQMNTIHYLNDIDDTFQKSLGE